MAGAQARGHAYFSHGVSTEKSASLGVRGIFFIVEPNRDELMQIGRLIDVGEVRPFVDTVLPLEEARAAFERGMRGHSRGTIVLRV